MSDPMNRRQALKAGLAALVGGSVLTGGNSELEAAPPKKAGEKYDPVKERIDLIQPMLDALEPATEEVKARIPEKFIDPERLEKQATSKIDMFEVDGSKHYVVAAFGEGHENEQLGAPAASSGKTAASRTAPKGGNSKLIVIDKSAKEATFEEVTGGLIEVKIDGEKLVSAKGSNKEKPLLLGGKEHVSIVSPGRDEPLKINLKTVTPERLDLLDEAVDVKTAELPRIAKQLTSFAEGSQIFSHGSKTIRVDISPSQLFSMAYVGVAKKVNNADANAHYIGTNLVVGSDAKGQKCGLIQLLPSRHNEIERYTSPGERTDRASLGQLQFQMNGQDIGAAIKLDGQAVPPSLDDPAKAVTEEQVSSPERKNSLAALQWLLAQRWQIEDGKPSKYLKGGLAEAPEGSYTLGAFADGRINTPLLEARAKNEPLKFTGFAQGLAK